MAAVASANHMLRRPVPGIAGCHANVRLSGENDLQAASSKRCMYVRYFEMGRKSGREYSLLFRMRLSMCTLWVLLI